MVLDRERHWAGPVLPVSLLYDSRLCECNSLLSCVCGCVCRHGRVWGVCVCHVHASAMEARIGH